MKYRVFEWRIIMNIIGKWDIAEVKVFSSEGLDLVWRTAAEILADKNSDDYVKQSLQYSYLFTEDGKALLLFPIPADVPKEEIEAAAASGEFRLYDEHTIVLEEKAWKEEKGKFFFAPGTEGENLGEAASPWVDITETPDGIEVMSYRLIRR